MRRQLPTMARMLMIDDYPEMLDLAVKYLARPGLEIVTCQCPKEALARMADEHFDLILTDLMMPNVDGFAIVEAANAHPEKIPCIIITGYGNTENLKRSLTVECFAFLEKPCNWDYLNLLIERALAKDVPARESTRILRKDQI